MAIRFGGSSSGFTVVSPTFDTRTFDCGTDYKLYINRIDKQCRETKQISDALCKLQEINENIIKPRSGGDCVQRVSVTVTEVPYQPVLEARNPCTTIDLLPDDEPLLKVADSTCQPGVKALEITLSVSGYGDGTAFMQDTTIIADAIADFTGVLDEFVGWVNRVDRWIVDSFDYNAPINDFHTFDLSVRGTIVPTDSTDRIALGGCVGTSNTYQTRLSLAMDFQSGVVRQERIVVFTGEFDSITDAVNSFEINCT